ncbi:MAG: tRNA epoxyqueuosine(34) reductase QueG [Eubacteriales bacterium]
MESYLAGKLAPAGELRISKTIEQVDRMDWVSIKDEIKNYARIIGIDKIGFTDARPLSEHLPLLIRRKDAGHAYAVNEGDPHKRVDPSKHIPDAKSVISAAVVYPWQETSQEPAAQSVSGPARGRISLISRGTDYHVVVRDKLEKLREHIMSVVPKAQTIITVDNEEILEKAIAVKAGLGWFGRNTLLVTPEYGSWVCLGELITDLPFPPDQPLGSGCGSCRRCVDSCPTGALDEDKNLNPDRCLAAITQSKCLPPPGIRELMGKTLYGCDICQQACPYNAKAKAVGHREFTGDPENAFPVLAEILDMTNAAYKKRFGLTSGAWRGRTPLQRNAVIAAANLKDAGTVPALVKILCSDSRVVMRGAAAWALGEIGTLAGIQALEKALKTEKDPQVMVEIENGLKRRQ